MPSIRLNDFQTYRLYEFFKSQANKGVPHWRRNMRLHDAWGIEDIEEAIQKNAKIQNEFLHAVRIWEGGGKQGSPPDMPKMTEFRSDQKPAPRELDLADLEYVNKAVSEWDKEDLPATAPGQQAGLPADASKVGEVYLAIFDAVKAAWDARSESATAKKMQDKKAARKAAKAEARA